MPAPEQDMHWPPKWAEPAFDQMEIHDAWYVGAPEVLSGVYRNNHYARNRPSQYRGGVVGAIARFWWGKPTVTGEERVKLHLPVPADIATMSADMLFADPPTFSIPNGTKSNRDGTVVKDKKQEHLDSVLNTPGTYTSLLEAAEVAAALGGGFVRAVWSKDDLEHVVFDVVHADNAVPSFRFGRLREVTFWTDLEHEDSKVRYRWLEHHEPGAVTHSLWRGEGERLGVKVDLAERDETKWLTTMQGVSDGRIATGVADGLTAEYVPNRMPNKLFRKDPMLRPAGESDFFGIEQAFDAIDEAWTSWARDLRLAKARIIVPNAYLESMGYGQGAMFDTDREVYEGLDFLDGPGGGNPISMHQFAIRVQEHMQTIDAWTAYALRTAGYSASELNDDGGGLQTATEVQSKKARSERTRDKKLAYWRESLSRFAWTLLKLEAQVYGGKDRPVPDEAPDVTFPAESQTDPEALARTGQLLQTARQASIETLVRMQHPDWDQQQISEEVDRIREENGVMVATPDGATDQGTQADRLRAALEQGAGNGESNEQQ